MLLGARLFLISSQKMKGLQRSVVSKCTSYEDRRHCCYILCIIMVRASDKSGLLHFHYKRFGYRPGIISQTNTIRALMQCICNNAVISGGEERRIQDFDGDT